MRTLILYLGLLVLAVLSACGGEAGEPDSESARLSPCPSDTDATSDPPSPSSSGCVRGTGGGGQGGGSAGAAAGGAGGSTMRSGTGVGGQAGGAAGAVPGGADGSITRSWSDSVTQTGSGTSSVITQNYTATVSVSLTKVDEGAWTITGTANIVSTYASDWSSRQTSSLGPCNVHYTDAATASGSVDVEGGLEARDGFYNFYVNIPGVDGRNETVRDDSGCNGPNNQETTPWSTAPITASGSGEMTSPRTISGNSSAPREGGDDTVSWSFTLPE